MNRAIPRMENKLVEMTLLNKNCEKVMPKILSILANNNGIKKTHVKFFQCYDKLIVWIHPVWLMFQYFAHHP